MLHCPRKPGKKLLYRKVLIFFGSFTPDGENVVCSCDLFWCVCLFFLCRNYMNDSLRTNVFVRFSPETIACACIFLAARQLKVGVNSA